MPIADMLINEASGHRVISFLDGNAGYNQIFMAEEDTSKTAFVCPGFVGLFEWVVMTFGPAFAYLDKCLDIISSFDEFVIRHLPREENGQSNALAQQASGYSVGKGKFNIRKPM